MTVRFFDLDLTGVSFDGMPKTQKMPTKVGIYQVTVADLLAWIIRGTLTFYRNNRGDGRFAKQTSDLAYQEGVVPDALGECPIGNHAGLVMMADWQSRCHGFLRRLLEGQMKAKEMREPVSVRFVADFMTAYRKHNSGVVHRAKNKIMNDDLLYGPMWTRIKSKLTPECVKAIGDAKWTIISTVLYCMDHFGRDHLNWTWPRIYLLRTHAMHLANNLPGDGVRVKVEDQLAFAEALEYWYQLMQSLREHAGPLNVKSITSSGGFMGFIAVAHLSDRLSMPKPGTLVNRILGHFEEISRMCPRLCRGDTEEIVEFNGRLKKYLGIKGNREAA